MGGIARSSRVAGRVTGRFVGAAAVGRVAKRYPIIGVTLVVWRWWRRRQERIERTSLRLKSGSTITVSDKPSRRGL
ncbi:MAG: hypothetical protein ACO3CG_01885 [Ilumatobacteraceae bacterium]